jgi:large subunit ribosomal protein L6
MSKIGKLPVNLPEKVTAKEDAGKLIITGSRGSLDYELPRSVKVNIGDHEITVTSSAKSKAGHAVFGTARAQIANMVKGVETGWVKRLELVGTGFKAEVSGDTLTLTVGFSHPVKIEAPAGITFKVEKLVITVEGNDKCLVGQVAANIRSVRPPEPYKGKGIKYVDEVIRRKLGKAAKTVGAAA